MINMDIEDAIYNRRTIRRFKQEPISLEILKKLVETPAEVIILTKSKFVVRDIDLFNQFKNIEVGISMSTLNDDFAKIIERGASRPSERVEALKELKNAGLKTYLFVSPFFPGITDYRNMIEKTLEFVDSYSFENLNFRPHNVPRIKGVIEKHYPELLLMYEEFRIDRTRWENIEREIEDYCEQKQLEYKIEFHHGGFSKS